MTDDPHNWAGVQRAGSALIDAASNDPRVASAQFGLLFATFCVMLGWDVERACALVVRMYPVAERVEREERKP